nr:MAG TPA: hypothetical protein [Caudoviricetes sp.]
MEIIHTQKPPITTSIRNLKPTECCYIKQASVESSRAELWMVVFHQDETIKVENEGTWCLSPVTGVYRKFSQRTECEPVEAALMVRE